MVFVQVAVNIPTAKAVYDYHLPEELQGRVGTGHLVSVPFGGQTTQGIVLGFVENASVAETKPVHELLDADPVLTPEQINLAQTLAEETLSPLAAFIGAMIPAGLAQHVDTQYSMARELTSSMDEMSQPQKRILKLISQRGTLRGRQMDRHLPRRVWEPAAKNLVRQGWLTSRSILPPPAVRPKYIRTAQLAVDPEEGRAAMPTLGHTAETLKRRQAALRFLINEPNAVNVSWVYAESGCNLADLQEMAERGLVVLRETEIWRDPVQRMAKSEPDAKAITLTAAQESALRTILSIFADDSAERSNPILMHGVTGSGKTEIYIRAAQEAIRGGKQAIILVPEIALTPQTVRRFLMRFPGQVGLIHSRLSAGERYDTWRRARLGLLKVIIGPRSALFTPFAHTGLIVVDECHDGSYYQSEPPFFHAAKAAQRYARICGAVCLMGSATPSIEQRYLAEQGEFRLLELPERIHVGQNKDLPREAIGLPLVEIIDMREELKAGNRSMFSQALHSTLRETLNASQQAILFLNRRGSATYVFCRECGYAARCPNCDTPLTFHSEVLPVSGSTMEAGSARVKLVCHRCGYTRQMLKICPVCKSRSIRAYGLGSERVEAEVRSLFPMARTLRWDWDTTRKKEAHEILLSHFAAHRADILIGTQMLAKGLDLPLVTLVGIVLADVGLNLPDPFAAERVFQVLTQVAGRAGRSTLGGKVVLQTFQPDHYAIQHAARHDYAGFYNQELAYRQALGYPPFSRLVRLEYRHQDTQRAETEARGLASELRKRVESGAHLETNLTGPVPCFFARMSGLYRWQIILSGPKPARILHNLPLHDWRVEVDPVSLL